MNLSERFWQPIGTQENPFDGTFDLQDCRIIDLLLDRHYEVTHLDGLFGYVTDNAKFLTSPSSFVIAISIISGVVGSILIIVLIIVIMHTRKKRRMRKLSTSTTVQSDIINRQKEDEEDSE